jgi:hypothetical protein
MFREVIATAVGHDGCLAVEIASPDEARAEPQFNSAGMSLNARMNYCYLVCEYALCAFGFELHAACE